MGTYWAKQLAEKWVVLWVQMYVLQMAAAWSVELARGWLVNTIRSQRPRNYSWGRHYFPIGRKRITRGSALRRMRATLLKPGTSVGLNLQVSPGLKFGHRVGHRYTSLKCFGPGQQQGRGCCKPQKRGEGALASRCVLFVFCSATRNGTRFSLERAPRRAVKAPRIHPRPTPRPDSRPA